MEGASLTAIVVTLALVLVACVAQVLVRALDVVDPTWIP